MGAGIVSRQNEPEQLKRLAAKKQLYLYENNLCVIQMLLAVSVAIGGALILNFKEGSEPLVAIAGASLALCDVIIFESFKGRWQKTAAKIQEQFDCYVLNLDWRKLKTGRQPELEVTTEFCSKFFNDPQEVKKLMDWYPKAVSDLPLDAARLLCQRENCLYDARLRQTYVLWLKIALFLLTSITLLIGLKFNATFLKSLSDLVAPLIPAYVIGLREIKQNNEALEASKRLFEHAQDLWEKVLNPVANENLSIYSRFLQDEIYDSRRRAPVIFDAFYLLFRARNEILLTETATNLVNEFLEKSKSPRSV